MKFQKDLNRKRLARTKRTRARIFGTLERPRLAVHRSLRYISAQLINDDAHKTLAHISSRTSGKEVTTKTKMQKAEIVGEMIAKAAAELGIRQAVFDRRGYKYHGNVKAVAEGARKAGLQI